MSQLSPCCSTGPFTIHWCPPPLQKWISDNQSNMTSRCSVNSIVGVGGSPEYFDRLGRYMLTCTITNANAREVESLDVGAHGKGAPVHAGATPALAEGTAGIKLGGRAETLQLQNLRHWSPGHMVRQNADAKSH